MTGLSLDERYNWDEMVDRKELEGLPKGIRNESGGFLTHLGKMQEKELGCSLRQIYVDHLAALPPSFDPSRVKLRSTNFS